MPGLERAAPVFGSPRLHLRRTDSTNSRARALAEAGAPHGTLVTAAQQTAGRGRQGRAWVAPSGRALLMSVVLRDPPALTPLAAGVAVADAVGPAAALKWPNDVLIDGHKVAGILVEGRPQEEWAILGIGLNVAVAPEDFPPELRDTAAGLGGEEADVEPMLARLLLALELRLSAPADALLESYRERDCLRGKTIDWNAGSGVAEGVDGSGRLIVVTSEGRRTLDAGEVHLRRA